MLRLVISLSPRDYCANLATSLIINNRRSYSASDCVQKGCRTWNKTNKYSNKTSPCLKQKTTTEMDVYFTEVQENESQILKNTPCIHNYTIRKPTQSCPGSAYCAQVCATFPSKLIHICGLRRASRARQQREHRRVSPHGSLHLRPRKAYSASSPRALLIVRLKLSI